MMSLLLGMCGKVLRQVRMSTSTNQLNQEAFQPALYKSTITARYERFGRAK
jgi:hypothetical protein